MVNPLNKKKKLKYEKIPNGKPIDQVKQIKYKFYMELQINRHSNNAL